MESTNDTTTAYIDIEATKQIVYAKPLMIITTGKTISYMTNAHYFPFSWVVDAATLHQQDFKTFEQALRFALLP